VIVDNSWRERGEIFGRGVFFNGRAPPWGSPNRRGRLRRDQWRDPSRVLHPRPVAGTIPRTKATPNNYRIDRISDAPVRNKK